MATGNPTQAIQTNFGAIVQQGASTFAQNAERKRVQAERDYQKQLQFEDRYGIDESLFNLEDTEFRTVNDTTTEALSMARDRYYDVYKALQKDPTNLDLKKRLGKIKNSVTNIGMSHQKMQALGEDYLKKIQNDEISGVDEEDWQTKLEAADEGRVAINYDADDNMQFLFYDKDGKLADVKGYKELLSGSLVNKIDVDTEVNELVKNIGGFKQSTVEGEYIRTQNVYGEAQQTQVNEWLDSQLKDDDVMADMLNQVTGGESKKKEGFTEEEYNKVKGYVERQVQGKYKGEDTLSANQVALTNKRIAADREKTKAGKGSVSLSPSVDSDGQPLIDKDNNVEFSVSRKKSDGSNVPIEIKTDNSDIFVSTIKRDYNGRLSVEGNQRVKLAGTYKSRDEALKSAKEEFKGKSLRRITESATSKGTYYAVTEYSDSDETLINAVADQIGEGDYEQLRDKLDASFQERFNANYEPFISMPVPEITPQQRNPASIQDLTDEQKQAARAKIDSLRKQ